MSVTACLPSSLKIAYFFAWIKGFDDETKLNITPKPGLLGCALCQTISKVILINLEHKLLLRSFALPIHSSVPSKYISPQLERLGSSDQIWTGRNNTCLSFLRNNSPPPKENNNLAPRKVHFEQCTSKGLRELEVTRGVQGIWSEWNETPNSRLALT